MGVATPMIVALTGFMASGKTTFGRAAAERLPPLERNIGFWTQA